MSALDYARAFSEKSQPEIKQMTVRLEMEMYECFKDAVDTVGISRQKVFEGMVASFIEEVMNEKGGN